MRRRRCNTCATLPLIFFGEATIFTPNQKPAGFVSRSATRRREEVSRPQLRCRSRCRSPLGLRRRSTETGTRTQDQLVKSQLLYQLSYLRFLYPLGRRGKWGSSGPVTREFLSGGEDSSVDRSNPPSSMAPYPRRAITRPLRILG